MNLQEILFKEINDNMLLKNELRELVERNITKVVKVDADDAISKERVIEYLKDTGMQLTQKNYEMASRFLQNKLKDVDENGEIQMTFTEQEYINHLGDFSVDEMNSLINVCILRRLQKIEEELKEEQYYEYDIRTVYDIKGATNISVLSELITQYAEKGYRVKNVFVNELGKNALSVGGVGVNTTSDQVVIIFERPKRKV